jgi:GNAT superfamily N-acetyltransferase
MDRSRGLEASCVKRICSRVVLVERYNIWRSSSHDVRQEPQSCPDPLQPDEAAPAKAHTTCRVEDGLITYAHIVDRAVVCRATVRLAKAYTRATLELRPDEAKLIDVITMPEYRGRGFGPRFIQHITRDMRRRVTGSIYARVWHRNSVSERAFAKAGWSRAGTVWFICPAFSGWGRGRKRMVRLSFLRPIAGGIRVFAFPRVKIAWRFQDTKY